MSNNKISKQTERALIKFFEVCENSKIVLKTGAFYEKQSLTYYKRLTTALRNLQKHSNFLSPTQIKKIKIDTMKLLNIEMDRIKKIHSDALKEIEKF